MPICQKSLQKEEGQTTFFFFAEKEKNMTIEERRKKIRERMQNRKPGVAYVSSNYAAPFADEFGFSPYYYQISSTLGLPRDFSHPDIEALITFDVDFGGDSVVRHLAERVRGGEKFSAGQQVTVPGNYWQKTFTVEFRESENAYGECLRAVVLDSRKSINLSPSVRRSSI